MGLSMLAGRVVQLASSDDKLMGETKSVLKFSRSKMPKVGRLRGALVKWPTRATNPSSTATNKKLAPRPAPESREEHSSGLKLESRESLFINFTKKSKNNVNLQCTARGKEPRAQSVTALTFISSALVIILLLGVQMTQQTFISSLMSYPSGALSSRETSAPFKTSFVSSSDNPALLRRNGALIDFQLAAEQQTSNNAESLLISRSDLDAIVPMGAGVAAQDGADSAPTGAFGASSLQVPRVYDKSAAAASDQQQAAELQEISMLMAMRSHADDLLAIPSTQLPSNTSSRVHPAESSSNDGAPVAIAAVAAPSTETPLASRGPTEADQTTPAPTTTPQPAVSAMSTSNEITVLTVNATTEVAEPLTSQTAATTTSTTSTSTSTSTSTTTAASSITTTTINQQITTPTDNTGAARPAVASSGAQGSRDAQVSATSLENAPAASSQSGGEEAASSAVANQTVPSSERQSTSASVQQAKPTVSEIVPVPAAGESATARSVLDRSPSSTTTVAPSATPDSAALLVEHRAILEGGENATDLDLDYMNMEVSPMGDGDDSPSAYQPSAQTADQPSRKAPNSTASPSISMSTSVSHSMSSSLLSHVDLNDRFRTSQQKTPAGQTTSAPGATVSSGANSTIASGGAPSSAAQESKAAATTRAPQANSHGSNEHRPSSTSDGQQQSTSAGGHTKHGLEPGAQHERVTPAASTSTKPPQAQSPSSIRATPEVAPSSTKAPSSSTSTTVVPRVLSSSRRPKSSVSHHRTYYSEPLAGDWRRRRKSGERTTSVEAERNTRQQRGRQVSQRENFAPTLNGADEEEANILTSYSIPSQLSRLSSLAASGSTGAGARALTGSAAALSVPTTTRPRDRVLGSRATQATSEESTTRKPAAPVDSPARQADASMRQQRPTELASPPARPRSSATADESSTGSYNQSAAAPAPATTTAATGTDSGDVRSSIIRVASEQTPLQQQTADLAFRLAEGGPGESMMTLIASSISAAARAPEPAQPLPQAESRPVLTVATDASTSAPQRSITAPSTTTTTTTTKATPVSTSRKPAKIAVDLQNEPAARQVDEDLRRSLKSVAPEVAEVARDVGASARRESPALQSNAYRSQQQARRSEREKSATRDGSNKLRNIKETYPEPSAQFDSGQWRPDTHVDYSSPSAGSYEGPDEEQRLAADGSRQGSSAAVGSSLPGQPGVDYPVHWQVPKTSFDCRNYEQSGFYADVESDCQAYHSCHRGRGGRHTFLCPNGTLFSQELLTCDWWYNVECSASRMYMPNESSEQPHSPASHDPHQPKGSTSTTSNMTTGTALQRLARLTARDP